MDLRFYEIAEAYHDLQNPIEETQLARITAACDLQPGQRVLDLGCGGGYMLTTWARDYGINGIGVDISHKYIQRAEARAAAADVSDKLTWIVGDAAEYPRETHEFDFVTCLGATWIGGDTLGTLALMRKALNHRPHNLLLVGDIYFKQQPTEAAYEALGEESRSWAVGLSQYIERVEETGLTLVEMELATLSSFDRYYSRWWLSVYRFLQAHPDDPDADALRQWIKDNRRVYLEFEREYCGWGVFVFAEASSQAPDMDSIAGTRQISND